WTAPDHAVELKPARHICVGPEQCLAAADAHAHGRQHVAQAIEIERFRNVVERAEPHRFDGGVDRGGCGHQNDLTRRIETSNRPKQIEAVDIRHAEIEERGVWPSLREALQRVAAGVLSDDVEVEARGKALDYAERAWIVIDDEQLRSVC